MNAFTLENPETWLAVDLSSAIGTLSLVRLDKERGIFFRAYETISESGNHSEKFLDVLNNCLFEHGLSVGQVDRFITTSGPGSFTGLRIAYSSLKGLAFAHQKPIDTLYGSEARALAWLIKQNELHGFLDFSGFCSDKLVVLHYLTSNKILYSEFRVANGNISLTHERVIAKLSFLSSEKSAVYLLDARLSGSELPVDEDSRVETFPLRSSHLVDAFFHSQTRKSHRTLPEWIEASPQYFGTAEFKTVGVK